MIDEQTKNSFLDFLKSKNVAVISTVSPENQPTSATIYYIVDNNFNFYFMSKDTRKTQNIHSNNRVALLIARDNAPESAQIEGKAEKLAGNKEYDDKRDELIQALMRNSFSPPIFEIEGEDIFIYKVTPTWVRWLNLRDKKDPKGFVQIIP